MIALLLLLATAFADENDDIVIPSGPPVAPGHLYDYTITRGSRVEREQYGFLVNFNIAYVRDEVDAVCFWKEGAPIPTGPDRNFREGRDGEKFPCSAALNPYGEKFLIPDETKIYLARKDGEGGYIIWRVVTCGTNKGTKPVLDRTIADCGKKDIK